MPVKFRCPACQGKLSIARRKSGFQVECPRCGQPIIVPSVDDVQDEVNKFLKSAAAQLDAAAAGPPVKAPMMAPPQPQIKPAPTRHQPTQAEPTAKARLEDMPLFEQSDIDKYLAPKVPEPKPEGPKPVAPPPINSSERVVEADAIILTRSSATLLVLVIALLIGMAFCIGYVIGKP